MTTNLKHFFPIAVRIKRRFGEHQFALFGVDVQLLRAKGVVPNVAHVVPIPHNTILHWVVNIQHLPQLRALLANHQILKKFSNNKKKEINLFRLKSELKKENYL